MRRVSRCLPDNCDSPALIRVTGDWWHNQGGMHASYSSSCISVRTLSRFNIGVKQNRAKKKLS